MRSAKSTATKLTAVLLTAALTMALFSGCADVLSPSASAQPLAISEVVSSNSASLQDELMGSPDWVELENLSDAPVSLKGYTLSTSKNDANKYTFPDLAIGAGERLVIFCCKPLADMPAGKYCTGFNLSKNGSKLILSTEANIIVQQIDIPALETDISYARDESGEYFFCPLPTPNEKNAGPYYESLEDIEAAQSGGLVINEALPHPLSDAEPAWVELYNAGEEPLELSDYYLTEEPSNPLKSRLPQGTIEPGEYLVLKLSGNSSADELPMRIGSDEHLLSLSNHFGKSLDSIQWDAAILPAVSAGRGEDGSVRYFDAPTPGAKNGTEYASEDFGLKEGLSAVRITEILVKNTFSSIDADGDRSAWAELYNSSNQPVSLANYALSDDAKDPWKWMMPQIELAPQSYTLVFLSGKNRTAGELHAGFKLGGSDEALTLTSKSGRTVQTVALPEEKKENVSYGVDESGAWLFFPQPTPLAPNDTKGFTQIAQIDPNVFGGVRINEVLAVNPARSNQRDWVELYNSKAEAVNLKGYFLSDSEKNLKKWPLGELSIPSGGYAVVKGYEADGASGRLTIAASGERLFLSDPTGSVIDVYETGVLRTGVSSGLRDIAAGDTARALFRTPTPGEKNGADLYANIASPPRFSRGGGYADSPVSLAMSADTPNAAIYYTTDGSTPTEQSARYASPIEISSTKTVRAVAVADGMLKSDETVATYLFEKKHSLPVVCLSMTQADLTYVFGSPDRKEPRERAGYVEYYDKDGRLGVRFPAGFRIAGNGTRLFPQRSINLYLRGAYGRSSVTYPFFDDYAITTFHSLSLRNMGQDRWLSCVRDAYFGMVVKGMDLDYMEANFAVVYLNGKYWGLYEFKENQNEDFYASRRGIDPDKVEFVRSNTYAYKGNSQGIKSLFALAKRDMSNPDIYAEYIARADESAFTDYLVAQTYFSNADAYNQKYTRTTDGAMKWRPMFFDLDWSLMGNNPKRNILSAFFSAEGLEVGVPSLYGARNHVDTGLFYAFYRNGQWRDKFVKRYAEALNTTLSTARMLDLYDRMIASIEDEMPRHIARWNAPSSVDKWRSEVKALRACIADRRPYAIKGLQSFFSIPADEMHLLFPNDL